MNEYKTFNRNLNQIIKDSLGETIEYHTIKAWRQNQSEEYNKANRIFDEHKRKVQLDRDTIRAYTDQTEGYSIEWEKEDVRKTCQQLIHDPRFIKLTKLPYENQTPPNNSAKKIHYK